MAHDVFISYSTRDKAAADAICHALEAADVRCWIAPRDALAGHKYQGSIVRAIRDCQVMILVFSSGSNESDHVLREVTVASEERKPVVPFRIEDVSIADDLYYYISSLHWLDALTPPLDGHIRRLVTTVQGLVSGEARSPAAADPSPSDVQPLDAREMEEAGHVEYSVELIHPGRKKIDVIKRVRWQTGLGLREAKDLVDSAPCVVFRTTDSAVAGVLSDALRANGADVRITPPLPERGPADDSTVVVALTTIGPDKVGVVRALRSVTGLPLEDALLFTDYGGLLPISDESQGEAVVSALDAVGAEAQVTTIGDHRAGLPESERDGPIAIPEPPSLTPEELADYRAREEAEGTHRELDPLSRHDALLREAGFHVDRSQGRVYQVLGPGNMDQIGTLNGWFRFGEAAGALAVVFLITMIGFAAIGFLLGLVGVELFDLPTGHPVYRVLAVLMWGLWGAYLWDTRAKYKEYERISDRILKRVLAEE